MRSFVFIGAIIGFGILAFQTTQARAAIPQGSRDRLLPGADWSLDPWRFYDAGYDDPLIVYDDPDYYVDETDLIFTGGDMSEYPNQDYVTDYNAGTAEQNLTAFIEVIRSGEGTRGENGFITLYGGALWNGSLSDHPANQGWGGIELPDNYCRAAGLSPGCVSTAAGVGQFLKPTWNRVKRRLGLPDFSPDSQLAAMVELINEQGALPDVYAGRFQSAIQKVADVWASLPGSPYGQPVISLSKATRIYEENGGQLAA